MAEGTDATPGPRRRPEARGWWRWGLGIGMLGAAAFFALLRVLHSFDLYTPMWAVRPVPLRLLEGTVAVDRVPSEAGAFSGCNLLLVTLDTTRADRLGCYGHDGIETPNVDRLAREGVLFTRAIAPSPVTLPSHATILTGLHPLHHGARANALTRLGDEHVTLAEALKEAGYETAAFVSAFVLDEQFGIAQGFDHYDADVAQTSPFWSAVAERRGDETCDRALAWLQDRKRTPFFLWVHFFDPHWAYEPPSPHAQRYRHMPYDGEIAFADEQLGRLLTLLDERGLSDTTLVVLASDHGEGLLQHDEPTHGCLVHDSTLHVPLILRCGRRLGGGAYVSPVVGLVDVMPTVLTLLGVRVPAGLDGVDLTKPPNGSRALYVETLEGLAEYGWAALLGVREGDLKYIHGPRPELYDLGRDPYEEDNVIAEKADLARALRQRLVEFYGEDLAAAGELGAVLDLAPAERARLESLGYVASNVEQAPAGGVRPDPKEMMPLLMRVGMSFQSDREDWLEHAIAELEGLVREHPDFYLAHRELGTAYATRGDLERAAGSFERCLELQPSNLVPLHKLAALRDEQQDQAGAIACYRRVLELQPDHFPTLERLGRLLLTRGEHAEAARLLARAHAILPAAEMPALAGATALEKLDRTDEAIAMLSSTLAADADTRNVRTRLARLLKEQRRYDAAVGVLRTGMERSPEHLDFAANLALTLLAVPDADGKARDEAAAIMGRLCEQTAYANAGYVHVLGKALAALGRFDEAAELARRAVRLAQEQGDDRLAQMIRADEASFRRSAERATPTSRP